MSTSNKGITTSNKGNATSNKSITTSNKGITTSNKVITTSNKGITTSNNGITTSNKGITTSNNGITTSNKSITTSSSNKGIASSLQPIDLQHLTFLRISNVSPSSTMGTMSLANHRCPGVLITGAMCNHPEGILSLKHGGLAANCVVAPFVLQTPKPRCND